MSSLSKQTRCERRSLVASYVVAVLDSRDAELMAAHLAGCTEYQEVSGCTDALTAWGIQELPLSTPLWERLVERIPHVPQKKAPASAAPAQSSSVAHGWPEPQWKEAAPGITCKLLSTDGETDRVSMLVRLAPGISYPRHRHAGREELYLLEGELWIEDRKLQPGDYNRAEPGTSDHRVWSETGCMCLLITSPSDELR